MEKDIKKRKLSKSPEAGQKKVKTNGAVVLAPERLKGINLFKDIFLRDYKKD